MSDIDNVKHFQVVGDLMAMTSLGRVDRLLTFALATLVAACANPPYAPPSPETGPTASVLFATTSNRSFAFSFYANGEDCSGGNVSLRQGNALYAQGRESLLVRVNKELAFRFESGYGNLAEYKRCTLIVSFKPEAAARYKVQHSTDDKECRVVVTRLVSEGGVERETPEPTAKLRTPRAALMQSDPFCEAVR